MALSKKVAFGVGVGVGLGVLVLVGLGVNFLLFRRKRHSTEAGNFAYPQAIQGINTLHWEPEGRGEPEDLENLDNQTLPLPPPRCVLKEPWWKRDIESLVPRGWVRKIGRGALWKGKKDDDMPPAEMGSSPIPQGEVGPANQRQELPKVDPRHAIRFIERTEAPFQEERIEVGQADTRCLQTSYAIHHGGSFAPTDLVPETALIKPSPTHGGGASITLPASRPKYGRARSGEYRGSSDPSIKRHPSQRSSDTLHATTPFPSVYDEDTLPRSCSVQQLRSVQGQRDRGGRTVFPLFDEDDEPVMSATSFPGMEWVPAWDDEEPMSSSLHSYQASPKEPDLVMSPWVFEHKPNPVMFQHLQFAKEVARTSDVDTQTPDTHGNQSSLTTTTSVSSHQQVDEKMVQPLEGYNTSPAQASQNFSMLHPTSTTSESAYPSSASSTPAEFLVCGRCATTWPNESEFDKHLSQRRCKRNACDLCPARYSLRADLKRHKHTVHRDQYPPPQVYVCENPKCSAPNYKFLRRDNFERHVRKCTASRREAETSDQRMIPNLYGE